LTINPANDQLTFTRIIDSPAENTLYIETDLKKVTVL